MGKAAENNLSGILRNPCGNLSKEHGAILDAYRQQAMLSGFQKIIMFLCSASSVLGCVFFIRSEVIGDAGLRLPSA